MLSSEKTLELSRLYKIDTFSVQREFAQIVFLDALYAQPKSTDLVFKGGTSLRLIYGASRFSEDLDFTLLTDISAVRILLDKAVDSFSEHFPGAYIKSKPLEKDIPGYAYLLKFSLPDLPFEATLKLDFFLRGDVFDTIQNHLVQVKGYPLSPARPLIKVLSKKELLAEKIRAFMSRDRLRDLYDLAFLLNDTEIDADLVSKKMLYYKKEFNKGDFIKKLDEVNIEDFKRDLSKFLPINERGLNTYQNVLDIVRRGLVYS